MKLQPAVKKETAHIALGTAAGVAVMFAVWRWRIFCCWA